MMTNLQKISEINYIVNVSFPPFRSEFEYELLLRYDLYTDKHTQWFYFRVQNARKGQKYRFTITNFMKVRFINSCVFEHLENVHIRCYPL